MQTAILQHEEKQVIETEISPMLERAKTLVIKNKDERSFAVSILKTAEEIEERIEMIFHPTRNKQVTYRAYEAALDTEKRFYGPTKETKDLIKKELKRFDTDQAIKAQLESERQEAERRDREAKERAKLEAKAQKELEKGNEAAAETLLEQADNVQVAPSFTPPPAATRRLVTKARPTNMFKLCKLIAEGVIPFSVVEIKISALNDWAKGQDPKQKFDGLELYQEVASRV